ncbi:type II toxin-antitoxin system HipA family toxin [Marinobacter sp. C2H3]|uniref:type II toxin-antitoxin system HipA family toxin n=1 Tax=Marinobacter sp. C2H3 TaxID=3119003 RepID=UPI00300EE6A5
MNCLTCLQPLPEGHYIQHHSSCLETLFGSSTINIELAVDRRTFVESLPAFTSGYSISGVQMKCHLTINDRGLKLADAGGTYILKPSPERYPFAAENEHASMVLMRNLGFDVPPCSLLSLGDGHKVFVVQRFDRTPDGEKIHQEDAMQALGVSNFRPENKYTAASYQTVLQLSIKYGGQSCGHELIRRLAFSYLIGNDDHHLKNIAFLKEPFRLAPVYDVLASSLFSTSPLSPTMALRFLAHGEPDYFQHMGNGFYSGGDFIQLAEATGLDAPVVRKTIDNLVERLKTEASKTLHASFMPQEMTFRYLELVRQRCQFLEFG